MASDSSGSDEALPEQVYRTVSPPYRGRPNTEMHTVGLLMVAIMFVLFLPLGIVALALWIVLKIAGSLR